MCKISIITPAYNAAEFLPKTVESVLSQTFTDYEMIIVDDYSGDDTYKIACDYAERDSRIKVIKHKKNAGVAAARNTALKAAKGDFIAFLDSDDLWMSDKLEKQYNFMKENGYVLTYTQYRMILENNEQSGIVKVPSRMTYRKIYGNTSIACLTVMVDRKTAGDFEMPPLKHTEDQCTWQEILKRGYIAYALNEPLALYRANNTSLTSNKVGAAKKQWNTYRKYHKMSVIKSAYYFCCYAFNAVIKHFFNR